jgi:hypothetical protein
LSNPPSADTRGRGEPKCRKDPADRWVRTSDLWYKSDSKIAVLGNILKTTAFCTLQHWVIYATSRFPQLLGENIVQFRIFLTSSTFTSFHLLNIGSFSSLTDNLGTTRLHISSVNFFNYNIWCTIMKLQKIICVLISRTLSLINGVILREV